MPDDERDGGRDLADRRRLEGDFMLAMRRTSSLMQLMSQAAAERLGINVTDLNCLNVVALTGSMTAGELARATGLTTASITGVLDRLEESGFIRRERDSRDRRKVIVTLSFSRRAQDIAPVFAPLVRSWRATAARYTAEELRVLVGFQLEIEQILRDQLARLRAGLP